MRIRFNPTWEEQQEETRRYLATLTYPERLKNFFRMQKMFNRKSPVVRYDLELCAPFPIVPYR